MKGDENNKKVTKHVDQKNKVTQFDINVFLNFLLKKILQFNLVELISKYITSLFNTIMTFLNSILTFLKNIPSRFSNKGAKIHSEVTDTNPTHNPLHDNPTNDSANTSYKVHSSDLIANGQSIPHDSTVTDVNALDDNAVYFKKDDLLAFLKQEKIVIVDPDIQELLSSTYFIRIADLPKGGFGITLLDSNLHKVKIAEKTLNDLSRIMLTNPDAAKMIKDAVDTSAGIDNLVAGSFPLLITDGGVKKYTTYETYKISLDKACLSGEKTIVRSLINCALVEENGEEIMPGFRTFLQTYKVPDDVEQIRDLVDDIKRKNDIKDFNPDDNAKVSDSNPSNKV